MAIQSDIIQLLGMAEVGDSLPISISLTHPLYDKNLSTWEKMRDAYGGEDDIKSKTTRYLSKLNGQSSEEYGNYLARALWNDAPKYTIKNYLGMIYRKAPQIFYSENISEEEKPPVNYFDKITDQGESLSEFSLDVAEEILKTNRVGVLVDFPKMNDVGNILDLTKYDYEQREIKPHLSLYDAFSIINWHWEYIDYKLVPVYFVLKETVFDGFQSGSLVSSQSDIYRVLILQPWGDSYRYKQVVFRERIDKGTTFSDVVEVIDPMMNGKYLPFIPFYILDDKGISYKTIEKPMLNGLVDIAIGYFKNSADWENFLHMLGSPTLVFPGWDKKVYGDPRLGGALAVPKGCEPKMVQASSDQSIRGEMDKKIEQMAVFGAQRIGGSAQYVANVDTARVSSTSDSSTLTIMVKSLSRSFTNIVKFLLKWGQYAIEGVNVEFNNDFFDDPISGEELLSWVKVWQNGGISTSTLLYNLRKRELYREGWTDEEEMDGIKKALDEQFDISGERYVEILNTISQMQEDIQATITSSSSGQTLLSMSTAAGGSNVSTSTDVSDKSMDTAQARNNETPGKSNASAKEQTDQTKIANQKDPTQDHTDNKEK